MGVLPHHAQVGGLRPHHLPSSAGVSRCDGIVATPAHGECWAAAAPAMRGAADGLAPIVRRASARSLYPQLSGRIAPSSAPRPPSRSESPSGTSASSLTVNWLATRLPPWRTKSGAGKPHQHDAAAAPRHVALRGGAASSPGRRRLRRHRNRALLSFCRRTPSGRAASGKPPFGDVGRSSQRSVKVHQAFSVIPAINSTPSDRGSDAAPELSIAPNEGAVTETNLPLALTVQEASQVLRLDPRTVRAMLRAGDLEGNQRGHAIRISRSSVLDWLCGKRRVPRSKRWSR